MTARERHQGWGGNIAALRQRLGLTQQAFAEAVGVTQQTVSGWENGLYAPSDTLKGRVAGVLGQPSHVIFPIEAVTT